MEMTLKEKAAHEKRMLALEKKVAKLVERNGHIKVNLVDTKEGDEGLWATPCTKRDHSIYEKNTRGDQIRVRLCNQPLDFRFRWGDEVVCTTQGLDRPTFEPEERGV